MKKADIALVGLAVMGENLVMNMESKGFTVAVYNRTTEKVKRFVEGRAAGKNIIGCYSIEELVANLEKPRKVFMMVKAGAAVVSSSSCSRSWKKGISLLTAATATSRTPSAAPLMWRARAYCMWAAASPAAKRAR